MSARVTLFLAGAVLVGFFASPAAPVAARAVITLASLSIATFLVVRAAVSDPLARDVKLRQVQSVEGAIGKREARDPRPLDEAVVGTWRNGNELTIALDENGMSVTRVIANR